MRSVRAALYDASAAAESAAGAAAIVAASYSYVLDAAIPIVTIAGK
jgi:hypothetical protein